MLVYWLNNLSRLDIREEGIRYTAPGICLASEWEGVAGYGTRVMGTQDVEVLMLKTPGMKLAPVLDAGHKAMPLISILSIMIGRGPIVDRTGMYADIIPLGLFDEHWRVGEIGSLISHYAPKAFQTEIKR